MATLTTALAIAAGSAALVGSLYGVKSIESAPPEVSQPEEPAVTEQPAVQEPAVPKQPAAAPFSSSTFYPDAGLAQDSQYSFGALSELRRQEAAAVPVEEQPVNTATAPSLPAQPSDEMAGGAIGRPKWGSLSSTVPTGELPTGVSTAIASITGSLDPRGLREQIIIVTKQLEAAQYTFYQAEEKIKVVNARYIEERKKYIVKYAESKNAETISKIYDKKLSNQGQQKGKNDPEVKAKQAEIDKASGEDKKRLEREKQTMMQNVPVDDKILDEWTAKYSRALGDKIAADDDRDDAERDKRKYQAQLVELKTKKDEQEKLVKDLKAKLKILLGLLQKQSGVVKPAQKPADWDARTRRYALAAKKFNDAESNLRTFISETWLPLDGDKTIQSTYVGQLNALKKLFETAKAEMDLARMALTATTGSKVTVAANEFAAFVAQVEDITRNAVNRDGSIRPAFQNLPGTTAGYPNDVRLLKDFAKKEKLRIVADTYYEIANQDPKSLIANMQKYLEYFAKLLGTQQTGLVTAASERVQIGLKIEVTQLILKQFMTEMLQKAANSVVRLPPELPRSPQETLYTDLRNETNTFVDKQLYTIKKMFQSIIDARKTLSPGDISFKNLLQLQRQAQLLFPLPTPFPTGKCELLFKPEIWKYFKTGMYDNKDILTVVLENPMDKQKFLDEIGFIRVSNFLEAQAYSKTPGADQDTALDLMKKAAFKEYVDGVDRLAYNAPDSQTYEAGGANYVWTSILATNRPRLENYSVRAIIDPFVQVHIAAPRLLITNKAYAEDLHHYSDGIAKFVPGVYLNAKPDPPGTSRILPIVDFKNACEIDGNVGHGQVESDRIIAILSRLEIIEPANTTPNDPLLKLIEKMEQKKSIDLTRSDQAIGVSKLGLRGFNNGIGAWIIMKVEDSKDKRDINFIQTFLTFRSSKFRSIQYGDTTEYNGKTWNSRELYATLFIKHLMKMPSFESDSEKFVPTDADWLKLSTDYNVNIVLYKEAAPVGKIDTSAARRIAATTYGVFKSINGRYYPILVQAAAAVVPAIPRGAIPADVGMIQRGIFGGAVDGIYFPVPEEPAPVESTSLKKAVIEPAKTIARVAYKTIIRPWLSQDFSCVTNRGQKSFYENVMKGVRQEKCVIKIDSLLLKLCKDADDSKDNFIGQGGFKDVFCAIVEKDYKELKKGTKVALLYYRNSEENPDTIVEGSLIPEKPHKTSEEFLNAVGPFLDRQKKAAELGFAPNVYALGFVNGVGGFAVIEFVSGTSLANLIKTKSLTENHLQKLTDAFLKLGNKDITQNDPNAENYILKYDKFIFIDDLSQLYENKKPRSISEHMRSSISTLKKIVNMSDATEMEKSFNRFLSAILEYTFESKSLLRRQYRDDTKVETTLFHNAIIQMFADAIPDAQKFVGVAPEGIPPPPPIPEVAPKSIPPSPLDQAPHIDTVAANAKAASELFPQPSAGEQDADALVRGIPGPPRPPPLVEISGGRKRKHTMSWRRSRPSRYTRRKF